MVVNILSIFFFFYVMLDDTHLLEQGKKKLGEL
jgi:hypothetical protein